MNKTENYIILKPIAERFNRVASCITDEDIEHLIKDELRKQISTIDFKFVIQDIISEYLDNNEDEVVNMFKSSISNKFK